MRISEDLKPMMSDKEIKIIDDLLKDMEPLHCLEWGSGGSTIYFPTKYPMLNWLSVEHNGHYVQALSESLPHNANIVWVPDNEWYVDCIKHSRRFDFILIDGLQRERCLEIAKDIVTDDGIIMLHDSGRQEYQDFIKKHKGEKLCDGEEPYNGYFKHRGLAVFKK